MPASRSGDRQRQDLEANDPPGMLDRVDRHRGVEPRDVVFVVDDDHEQARRLVTADSRTTSKVDAASSGL